MNERLTKVRLWVGQVWIAFIQTDAPTGGSEEGVKDCYYQSLEELHGS